MIAEVSQNLPKLGTDALNQWQLILPRLSIFADILSVGRPAAFEKTKDRPVLLGALAWADVLLTLDQADFGGLMTAPFYGLRVMRPGTWLEQERSAGRLAEPL